MNLYRFVLAIRMRLGNVRPLPAIEPVGSGAIGRAESENHIDGESVRPEPIRAGRQKVATPTRSRWVDRAMAAAIAAIVLAILLGTSRDIAMGFDEAFTIRRELVLAEWFAGLANPPARMTRRDFFARPVLEHYWRFSRREPDGHPPFYALLGLAGWFPTRGWLDPLSAFRFGPIVLTALTCGVLSLHLARRYGRVAGLSVPALLLMMPRTFTHAHYAHYDMPTTCLWLLAMISFVKAIGSSRWSIAFGLFLGLASATKFTGWFAVAPPLAWAFLFEVGPAACRWLNTLVRNGGGATAAARRRPMPATSCLLIGVPIAALVVYAIQPPWWSDPFRGVVRFLESNLSRARTVPVPSYYLGTVYPFALPWHNTIVLTAITTPVLTLVLALAGLVGAVARWRTDPPTMIWPLSVATLMVVRALPAAPGHDVERLLLPSLVSLAVLSGLGAGWLAGGLRATRLAIQPYALIAGAVAESAVGFAQYYPYNLSYYNLTVGGLPGAERLGFEPTYYWDALGPEFAQWARAQSRRGSGPLELRFPFNQLGVVYLRAWGELPADLRIEGLDPTVRPYYVVQRSPGAYAPWDRVLEREGRPVFAVRRQGVDLLRVYTPEDAEHAFEASVREMAPAERARSLGF
jgi:hypothetical protein